MDSTEYLHILRYFECWKGALPIILQSVSICGGIHRSDYKNTAPMKMVHTRFIKIDADVTRDMRQPMWGGEKLSGLEGRLKEFKKILIEAFEERCYSVLYTLMYHLLHCMVEDIRILERYLFWTASSYEHFNVYIKQAY